MWTQEEIEKLIILYPNNFNKDINELSKKVDDKVTTIVNTVIENKKVSKFIELTSMEGFKTSISRDKIVSLVQYEEYCFVTTVAIEGTFTVREKAVDITKRLEE